MAENKQDKDNKMPHISVISQYIKDMSFENPEAPGSLARMEEAPKIDLSLDLGVSRLPEDDTFEVEIMIEANATIHGKRLFLVELKYAGVFHLVNIDEENLQPLLGVHCPAILFPFARKIVADTTQNGGFQPLMIDPIDFGALYHKKMSQQQEKQEK